MSGTVRRLAILSAALMFCVVGIDAHATLLRIRRRMATVPAVLLEQVDTVLAGADYAGAVEEIPPMEAPPLPAAATQMDAIVSSEIASNVSQEPVQDSVSDAQVKALDDKLAKEEEALAAQQAEAEKAADQAATEQQKTADDSQNAAKEQLEEAQRKLQEEEAEMQREREEAERLAKEKEEEEEQRLAEQERKAKQEQEEEEARLAEQEAEEERKRQQEAEAERLRDQELELEAIEHQAELAAPTVPDPLFEEPRNIVVEEEPLIQRAIVENRVIEQQEQKVQDTIEALPTEAVPMQHAEAPPTLSPISFVNSDSTGDLATPEPTEAPTEPATEAPTQPPTEAPTEPPTPEPTPDCAGTPEEPHIAVEELLPVKPELLDPSEMDDSNSKDVNMPILPDLDDRLSINNRDFDRAHQTILSADNDHRLFNNQNRKDCAKGLCNLVEEESRSIRD